MDINFRCQRITFGALYQGDKDVELAPQSIQKSGKKTIVDRTVFFLEMKKLFRTSGVQERLYLFPSHRTVSIPPAVSHRALSFNDLDS